MLYTISLLQRSQYTFNMLFQLGIIATFNYALQGTLMASYYRRMDTLSAVAYRGLTLGLSMLPLLYFVPKDIWINLPTYATIILGASICAALGNWSIAIAYRVLPVGIASALATSFVALAAVINGIIFFEEFLSGFQLLCIFLILLGVCFLGLSKSKGPLPKEYNVRRGIFQSLLFGIFLGLAIALVGSASREFHPFAVGYLWEFTIGIIAALVCLFRGLVGGKSLVVVSKKDFWTILLYSSPTVLGTGCYAMALTMGPIGVVATILSTGMVFSTILAFFFYGERLSARQWITMLFICLAIGALKLSI